MTTPEPSYRTIQLTQGQVALVSAHRFEELNAFKWRAAWSPTTQSFYATRTVRLPSGRRKTLGMNRAILGLDFGNKLHAEHENHDTLDNRDENLRVATRSQNNCNRRIQINNTSGFKGVSRNNKKWKAEIMKDRESLYLGTFSTPQEAYAAYCLAAKQLHGDFAKTA